MSLGQLNAFYQFLKTPNIFMHLLPLKRSSVLMTSIKTQTRLSAKEISLKWSLAKAVKPKLLHFFILFYLID